MRTPRLVLVSLSTAGLLASCSTNEGSAQTDLDSTCTWPASVDTYDAGSGGCTAASEFNLCTVPSGSTVLQDGGVLTPDGGAVDCSDLCSPTEYALSCFSAVDASGQLVYVAPDASLDCRALPLPTPFGETIYCCACSP